MITECSDMILELSDIILDMSDMISDVQLHLGGSGTQVFGILSHLAPHTIASFFFGHFGSLAPSN